MQENEQRDLSPQAAGLLHVTVHKFTKKDREEIIELKVQA